MAKSEHPKVLLIDLPLAVKEKLAAEGFNVDIGTFGKAYISAPRKYVQLDHSLPNFTEQEIVFLSTKQPSTFAQKPGPIQHHYTTTGNVTDPRPISMLASRRDADRIRKHGGVFVVFASALHQMSYGDGNNLDNWCFLSREFWFEIKNDDGSEIKPDLTHPFGRILARHLEGASFSCTFNISSIYKQWRPVATSKYGNAVAGLLLYGGGLVIIVPELKDPAAFAIDLLKGFLPEITPALFPDFEGGRWVHRPDYEQPKVLALERLGHEIQADADLRRAEVKRQIDELRTSVPYYYTILTGTGSQLVEAVAQSLRALGFQKVVNVDAAGADDDLREDLQILDGSPLVIVEVKGISGAPSDEDLLAAGKYVALRMKEMGRTDIVSLTVINYERHKPALERAKEPFRQIVVTSAIKQHIGLLTTWDLFRLLRGAERNAWPNAVVAPLFARSGRIEPIPVHYEYIGVIAGFIEKLTVVGLQIHSGSLRIGDRVAYELPADFLEEAVTSLQSNNVDIETADAGLHVGMTTILTKEQARDDVRVFRVRG
jgi:hypothetical protein